MFNLTLCEKFMYLVMFVFRIGLNFLVFVFFFFLLLKCSAETWRRIFQQTPLATSRNFSFLFFRYGSLFTEMKWLCVRSRVTTEQLYLSAGTSTCGEGKRARLMIDSCSNGSNGH